MPYVKSEDRDRIYKDPFIVPGNVHNAGELNYAVTVLCREYFKNNGGRYQQINDIVGALEGAKLELYRRVAAPYEDGKAAENGDVYK